MIDVIEGGQYAGEQLTSLIRHVREKLESNAPAEEFKVGIEISPLLLFFFICASHSYCQFYFSITVKKKMKVPPSTVEL